MAMIIIDCRDCPGETHFEVAMNFSINAPTLADRSVLPAEFGLDQNFPNPFNPATTFHFSLARREWTTLTVHDVLGREVAVIVNDVKQAGAYTVQWDASGVPSGVYFYRLHAGSFIDVKKLVLLK